MQESGLAEIIPFMCLSLPGASALPFPLGLVPWDRRCCSPSWVPWRAGSTLDCGSLFIDVAENTPFSEGRVF